MSLRVDDSRERLVSADAYFDVTDDSAGKVDALRAALAGQGIEASLQIVLSETAAGSMQFEAHNVGIVPIYLLSQWVLRWRGPDGREGFSPVSGLCGTDRWNTLPPGENKPVCGTSFGRNREPGRYVLRVDYVDREGRSLKASNELRYRVRH